MNTQTRTNNTIQYDEFGRDLSLRGRKDTQKQKEANEEANEEAISKANEEAADLFMTALFNKFKVMSWAEINYEEEEEEEEREREENRKKYKAITEERKLLIDAGKYELEEGEILE